MAEELLYYEDHKWMDNGMNELNIQRQDLKEEDALYVHVILIAGDRRIKAHRYILAAFSDYFCAMFKPEMEESKKKEVDIYGIDGEILELLIEFIYTGKVKVTVENVREVTMGANMLQLFGLVKAAADFAKRHLNDKNVFEMRQTGYLANNGEELGQWADKYIARNFTSVSQSREFFNLDQSNLKSLLERDDLNVPSQEKIYEAVIEWIKTDPEERKENALQLLECIRLPLIGPNYITEKIGNEKLLKDVPGLMEMLHNVCVFKASPSCFDLWPRMTPRIGYEIIYMIGKKNGHFAIESFDPSNKKYELICSNGPLYRTDFTATIMGQKIYVIGGRVNRQSTKTVEAYDLARDVWVTEAELNVARVGAASETIGGKIFVFGGCSNGQFLSSVECFGSLSEDNSNKSVWTTKSSINCARSHTASVALNGNVYVFGGIGCNVLQYDERYNVAEDRWKILNGDRIHTTLRRGMATTVLNNQIFTCGGINNWKSFYSFNTETQEWTQLPDMQLKRVVHSLVALNGKLYAIGGGVYCKEESTFIEYFDFTENEWHFIEYGGDLEVDSNAKSCIGPIIQA